MVVTFEILGFWKFSRNRLAGIQTRQATHTNSGNLARSWCFTGSGRFL